MSTRKRGTGWISTILVAGFAVILALMFGSAVGAAPNNPNAGPNPNANENAFNHQTSGNAGTSGTATEPQPLSTADENGVGANVPGPYDSTRDGSPSMNGSESGLAVGQPCAGCVGQADNKNPSGQLPGGIDPNAGFECDRNQGIGQTNPAHTGCVSETVTPPTAVAPQTPGVPGVGTAGTPNASVLGASAAAGSGGGLPRTGAAIAFEVLAGLVPLVVGAVALVAARARRGRVADAG